MNYTIASIKLAKQLYKEFLIPNFLKEELKPFSIIKHHMKKGNYQVIACQRQCQNSEVLAVAFIMIDPEKEARLLDYFAVKKEYRGQGIGAAFLQELKSNIPLIIETESLTEEIDEKEKQIRQKRNNFYAKNSVSQTKYCAKIWSCIYDIWVLQPEEANREEQILSLYNKLYKNMLPKKLYDKFCTIPYKPLP